MDSIELSVIIPVYNAGKTIGRCLDLLLQLVLCQDFGQIKLRFFVS